MLISVVTSRNAPGASTTALALTKAWPRPAILAECDPRGGDVQWGLAQGANVGAAGLLRLQVAARRRSMSESVWEEVVALPGEDGQEIPKYWLPGLLSPREAGSIDWVGVARALGAAGVDVIADCGTVFGDPVRAPRAIWNTADVVALVVRSTMLGTRIGQIAAAALQSDLMTGGRGVDLLGAVIVHAPGGYPTNQVVAELGDTALLGELPDDPAAAQQLAGVHPIGKRIARSPLMRAAAKLAHELGSRGQSVEAEQRDSSAALPPAVLPSSTNVPLSTDVPPPVTKSLQMEPRPAAAGKTLAGGVPRIAAPPNPREGAPR
ncbi:MAG: hypothetical protein ACR2P2_11805 [Nakamurella sp.]